MVGALLAGALITPTDLFAAVKYKAGVSYATGATVVTPEANSTKTGYMVLVDNAGKNYVVTVDNYAMVATPFEDALFSKSVMTIAGTATDFSFKVDGKAVSFTSGVGFGSMAASFPISGCDVTQGAMKIALVSSTQSVTLDLATATFSVDNTSATNTIAVKYIAESDLEIDWAATPKDDAALSDMNFGKYFVLMTADGQALQGVAAVTEGYATAIAEDFNPADPSFYWTLEKQGATGRVAFRNKGSRTDGKNIGLMSEGSSDLVYADLKKTGDKEGLANTTGAVSLKKNSNGTSATLATIYVGDAVETPISVNDLQSIYGASFAATITRNDKALENNPFTGSLTPVEWKSAGAATSYDVVPATRGTSFMLQNGDGNIIVMQVEDPYASSGNGDYAYKVLALTPKELGTAIKTTSTQYKYAYTFSIYALPLFNAGTDEAVDRIVVSGNSVNYELGSISLNTADNQTLAAEKLDSEKYLDAIKIKLSKANLINLKEVLKNPTFFTIKNVNTKEKYAAGTGVNFGKVLGLNEAGNVAFMKKDEVLFGQPETQWAITVNNGKMVIKNRENTEAKDAASTTSFYTLDPSQLYVVPGKANTYAWIKGGSLTQVDTLEIAPVATTAADGFQRFDADDVKDQLFYIGSYSATKGVSYVAESHKDNHQLGLLAEEKDATEWRLGALTYEENDAWNKPVSYTADTIRIESALGYWDADANKFTDTQTDDADKIYSNNSYLKILVYSLKNNDNNEYVKYDEVAARNRYATGLEGEKEGFKKLTDAQYFAVKVAGEDLYNLIPVTYVDATTDDGYADGTLNSVTDKLEAYEVKTSLSAHKIFAGNSASKGILARTSIYNRTENDLFTIEQKDAPAYLKLDQGQIIKLYREEYASESNVLYEKEGFLGVGNAVENAKINPALYVDTVYVNREGNNRWEYLLGVNITRIDTTYKCDEPSHSHLIHRADTTKGRFLVNFADSAIVAAGKEDIHVNKYMYSDSRGDWAKLGFVPGFRTADVLSIWNGEKGKADLIEVGTAAAQLVKFAFRIVDSEKNAFVIETGYKDLNVADYDEAIIERAGYLRYDNGVVYVVPEIEDAEIFMVNLDEDRTPTANEGVEASEISVIATDGAVIVKGAEGKKVVISNVLGQAIANTVITSSEATIAAPAGIVIVAVEGEAAVKAIVK